MNDARRERLKERFGALNASALVGIATSVLRGGTPTQAESGNQSPNVVAENDARQLAASPRAAASRRSDYKGKRRQVAFRLRADACRKVKLVLELRRGEGNDFFERVMEVAAEAELARLKSILEPALWALAEARVQSAHQE